MATSISAPLRAPRKVVRDQALNPPAILVYEITPERRHKLRVMSSELYSIWVHQSGRRPLPCFGTDYTQCENHGLPLRQQHYLFVEETSSPRIRLLRLTSGLVYVILPDLAEDGRNLNGMMLELWRENRYRPDSPLMGRIVKEECVENLIRQVPEIDWAVARMLNAPDRQTSWQNRRGPAQPAASSPAPIAEPQLLGELFAGGSKLTQARQKVQEDPANTEFANRVSQLYREGRKVDADKLWEERLAAVKKESTNAENGIR